MFSKDWHRRPVEKFLLTRVDFARILLDFGGLLTEICQLLTGFSPPCGEVSRGHALVSPLFEVSYVMSSAFFAIRQKTLGKKANKGFALNPLRARRPFMAVGVVELWVSYAKETWVSLAGGFYVVIRFAFLRNDRALAWSPSAPSGR